MLSRVDGLTGTHRGTPNPFRPRFAAPDLGYCSADPLPWVGPSDGKKSRRDETPTSARPLRLFLSKQPSTDAPRGPRCARNGLEEQTARQYVHRQGFDTADAVANFDIYREARA